MGGGEGGGECCTTRGQADPGCRLREGRLRGAPALRHRLPPQHPRLSGLCYNILPFLPVLDSNADVPEHIGTYLRRNKKICTGATYLNPFREKGKYCLEAFSKQK